MKRLLIVFVLFVGLGAAGLPVNAQVKKADKALKKQNYDEALEYVGEALQKKPEDAKAFEVKGRIYQAMASNAEDAEHVALLGQMMEAFHQAASLDTKMAEKVKNTLTLAYITQFQRGIEVFNEAQSTRDKNGYLQSARYFEGCTIIAPDSTGPYVNWAFAMIGADNDLEAIRPLEIAVEHGDTDADMYNYLSRLYLSNDRAADAIPLLEEATRQYPDHEEMQNNLLNAYTISGEMDRAIEVYGQTVANAPDNKIYRYNYGSLLLQDEQHDAAIEQLKAAVALDSVYSDAQYNLGAAYVNWAITVNTRISAIDDSLRANRSSLSDEEIKAKEAEIDSLAEERRELFGMAVAPLEKAKILVEAEGNDEYSFDESVDRCREKATGEFVETSKCSGDVTAICKVLFQSYVQTGQTEKGEAVQECAGY